MEEDERRKKERRVIVWDLDHTLMNTEGKWFGPVLDDLATITDRDLADVHKIFASVNATTFTFENFFEALGIPQSSWRITEAEYRLDLAERAQGCLYPELVDLLSSLQPIARQVLVTAGDPLWQEWKFNQLHALHEIFHEDDRHFVPLSGSKADVVERHRGASRLTFVDDSVRWQREVAARVSGVLHIRPVWPDTLGSVEHPDDDIEWAAVRTVQELKAALL